MNANFAIYDVDLNDQRFIFISQVASDPGDPVSPKIDAVLTWFEELKERVPVLEQLLCLNSLENDSQVLCPVSTINRVSPGEIVFTKAASQQPDPDEGKIITGPVQLKTSFSPDRSR